MKAMVGGFILLATTMPVTAQLKSMDLQGLCSQMPETSRDSMLCQFYIAGVYDGLFGGQIMAKRHMSSCLPAISGGQARLIVEKYMRDHPENLNMTADVLVASALFSAYPCKTSN